MSNTTGTAADVHPTAIVEDGAELGDRVTVGPRCTVGPRVRLGEGVTLLADVHVWGDTEIGAGATVYPYACLGFGPQHVKFDTSTPVGGVTIGAGCVVREHATIHASMYPDKRTVIGDRAYIMVNGHVGHDCLVGDDVIICNNALLAGHCEVADRAYISGSVSVHQFCRIGRGAMLAGGTACNADVPPYCTLIAPNQLGGLNLVGMRRGGISREAITVARRAYRDAFRDRCDRAEQLRRLDALADRSEPVAQMAEFVRTTRRGVLSGDGRPRPHVLHWLKNAIRKDAWAERAFDADPESGEHADGVA
jgi:UDP-N-acetylglucosamine acyltransferase